jgi:hypothetical protein
MRRSLSLPGILARVARRRKGGLDAAAFPTKLLPRYKSLKFKE